MAIQCNLWWGRVGSCSLDKVSTGLSGVQVGWHSRQPAIILCIVTLRDTWKGTSCLLSWGVWGNVCGGLVWPHTHTTLYTHTLFSSVPVLHWFPSIPAPHCAPPPGHIMSRACDKEAGSGGSGWGEGVADCQTGYSRSLPLSACLYGCTYSGCPPILFPRGLCVWRGEGERGGRKKREMWCCTKLCWSLSAEAMV